MWWGSFIIKNSAYILVIFDYKQIKFKYTLFL